MSEPPAKPAPDKAGEETARHPRVRLAVEVFCVAVGLALLLWAWRADRAWFEVHTMGFFACMTQPSELRHSIMKRWLGVVVGLVMILVVRPRAGRWAGRRSALQVVSAFGVTFVAALLALVASEFILRRTPQRPGPVTYNYEPLSDHDPRLEWIPMASHTSDHRVGDKDLHFYVDANSWRVRSPDEVIDFDKATILFTGESIGSGFGLNYEETYPFMVGQDLGVQVVNLAVQAYSIGQSYVRMSDALPRFKRPLAAVTLVVPPSIMRNVTADRPRLEFADDGSYTVHPRHDDDWFSFVRGSRLMTVYYAAIDYRSDEAFRIARATFVATARQATARGAFPLFVFTQWKEYCLPSDDGDLVVVHNLFDGLDVTHIRADAPRDTFDPSIQHINARGQRVLADAIEHALRDHGIPAPTTSAGELPK
jgi:hypothetical protein